MGKQTGRQDGLDGPVHREAGVGRVHEDAHRGRLAREGGLEADVADDGGVDPQLFNGCANGGGRHRHNGWQGLEMWQYASSPIPCPLSWDSFAL